MKYCGLVLVVAAALLLSACVTTTPTPPTATPVTQEPVGSPYPESTLQTLPVQAYPAAAVTVTAETGSLYPDLSDGAQVEWIQASSLILNKEVSKVMQTHEMKVYLTLKDGRTLFTVEPEIDAIMEVIQQCGEPCRTITIATE